MNKLEKIIFLILLPYMLYEYFLPKTGKKHGVGLVNKITILFKILNAKLNIPTETDFLEIMTMVTHILKQDSNSGCIIECGVFKGGCTACLSLVAHYTDQNIHAFDTFEGLPDSQDSLIISPLGVRQRRFKKGEFSSGIQETKANVQLYGDISRVEFHKGLFSEQLKGFDQNCTFVYTDVDLRKSLETCLENLWPNLQDGGHWFTHEAHHAKISDLFFDREFWLNRLDERHPTLVGAGTGLGLYPSSGNFVSRLGYAVKNK
jgi:hypothetical protein